MHWGGSGLTLANGGRQVPALRRDCGPGLGGCRERSPRPSAPFPLGHPDSDAPFAATVALALRFPLPRLPERLSLSLPAPSSQVGPKQAPQPQPQPGRGVLGPSPPARGGHRGTECAQRSPGTAGGSRSFAAPRAWLSPRASALTSPGCQARTRPGRSRDGEGTPDPGPAGRATGPGSGRPRGLQRFGAPGPQLPAAPSRRRP